MKKIFAFVIAAMVAVATNAQIVSSTSKLISAKEKTESLKFFHFGIGTNTFQGLDEFDGAGPAFGLRFGYQFQKPMGEKGFFRGMDFSIGTRGFKYEEEENRWSLKAWNLQWIPFFFGYDFHPVNDVSIRPQLGVYIAMDFGGKFKYEGLDEYGHPDYSEDLSIWDYEGTDYNYYGEYAPYDLGYVFGCDVIYQQRWLAGISFQKGFFPYDTEESGSAFNFLVRVGYVLGGR